MDFDFGGNGEYEDIVSDSRMADRESSKSKGGKHYNRKSHGGFDWWKRMSKGMRAAIISITSVVLVLAIALGWFFTYWRYNYNPITEKPEELGFESQIDKEIINIALFGIDTRNKNTFAGNSDSIMILSLNTQLKTVKIVSIMRDTIVPIATDGKAKYAKINSAYAKSPETAIKTLNEIFDLDISEYATVNFYGMTEIIDAVGGIDATVTEDELKWKGKDHPNLNNCMDEICENLGLNAEKYYIKSAGDHHMNGVQAVAYSRVRNCKSIWGTTDDYGRTDRQRHVMEQLFNKAITLEKSKYPKLAKALIPCTETSLSYTQILSLAFNMLLNKPTFYQARIPQDDWQMTFRWSGYGSVVYYDLDYVSRVLHAVFYDNMTVEEYVELNGVDKNDWFARTGKKPSSGTASENTSSSSSQTISSQTDASSNNVSSDNGQSETTSSKGDSSDTSSTESADTSSIQSSDEVSSQTESSSTDTTSEGDE